MEIVKDSIILLPSCWEELDTHYSRALVCLIRSLGRAPGSGGRAGRGRRKPIPRDAWCTLTGRRRRWWCPLGIRGGIVHRGKELFMRKTVAVSLALVLVLGGVGCGGGDAGEADAVPQVEVEGMAVGAATGELGRVVDHFRGSGLEVTDVHAKAYEIVGASNGIGFEVGGGMVELYLFDPATADPAVLGRLQTARDTGIWDAGVGFQMPALVKGNILLLGLQMGQWEHPQRSRIEEAFRAF